MTTQGKPFCPICKVVAMNDVSITTAGSYFQCPKCGYEVYGTDLSAGKFNIVEHFFCDSDQTKIKPSCQDAKCPSFAVCRPGLAAHRNQFLR